MTGATHIEFDEHHALDIAKTIVKRACDNYANRGETRIPKSSAQAVVPGFSHEYLNYMLGGFYRQSFRPLIEAIASGRIRGVAADVGCNNPGLTQDKAHMDVIKRAAEERRPGREHRLRQALAAGKYGYLTRRGRVGQGWPRPA